MPFPNEHSARLRNPGDFSADTFRRKNGGTVFGSVKIPKTIVIIWAKLKGSDKPSDPPLPQALRFPIDDWTEAQARKWILDNEFDDNVILFEPAEPEEESEPATESFRDMTPDMLREKHREIHERWCPKSTERSVLVESHLDLLKEIARRRIKFDHVVSDGLDLETLNRLKVKESKHKRLARMFEEVSEDLDETTEDSIQEQEQDPQLGPEFGEKDKDWVNPREDGACPIEFPSLARFSGSVARCYSSEFADKLTKEGKFPTRVSEAFHIRDTHWVPVPESGSCPTTHPNKLGFPGQDVTRCFTDSAASAIRGMREQVDKLTNDRANLREAVENNPGERCGSCQHFSDPDVCRIIEGPVNKDQVCDWIQSREVDAPTYDVSDEDWEAFGRGMIEEQPYQHIVRDVAITPAGPLVMIEDTAKPNPHRFSLTKEFHVGHTCFDIATQAFTPEGFKSVDDLRVGMEVWSLDLGTNEIMPSRIKRIFRYPYDGQLLRFAGRKYDFAVTPNHRVLCKLIEAGDRVEQYTEARALLSQGTGTGAVAQKLALPISTVSRWKHKEIPRFERSGFSFFEAGEVFERYKFLLPRPDGYLEEQFQGEAPSDLDAFAYLAGWYLSEGWSVWCNGSWCTNFANSDPNDLEEIRSLFRKIGVGFSEKIDTDKCTTIYSYDRRLHEWLEDFGCRANEKRIPVRFKNGPRRLLENLLRTYLVGDGSQSGENAYTATTTSYGLVQDLVEIGFKLGFWPSFKKYPATRKFIVRKFYDCSAFWNVSLSKPKGIACNNRNKWSRESYRGEVWCVEVERNSNLAIVRNGKITFSGNSLEHHWTQEEVDRLIKIGQENTENVHESDNSEEIWARGAIKFVTQNFCRGWSSLNESDRHEAWRQGLEVYIEENPGGENGSGNWFQSRGFSHAARVFRERQRASQDI